MSQTGLCGGCMCGAVRYEGRGEVRDLCYCHCASCRRATGVPAGTWGTFDRDRFSITRGTLAEYNSSPGVMRGFCASCGTSLTYRSDERAWEIDVALGTLDDPNAHAPRAHIWVREKLCWEHLGDGLPQFPTTQTARKP